MIFSGGLNILILPGRLNILILAGRLNVLVLSRSLNVLVLPRRRYAATLPSPRESPRITLSLCHRLLLAQESLGLGNFDRASGLRPICRRRQPHH